MLRSEGTFPTKLILLFATDHHVLRLLTLRYPKNGAETSDQNSIHSWCICVWIKVVVER